MSELISAPQMATVILIGLTLANIFFLTLSSAMVRFIFAIFTFVIAAVSVTMAGISFSPWLQMMAVVMSLICMFLAAKAKG